MGCSSRPKVSILWSGLAVESILLVGKGGQQKRGRKMLDKKEEKKRAGLMSIKGSCLPSTMDEAKKEEEGMKIWRMRNKKKKK